MRRSKGFLVLVSALTLSLTLSGCLGSLAGESGSLFSGLFSDGGDNMWSLFSMIALQVGAKAGSKMAEDGDLSDGEFMEAMGEAIIPVASSMATSRLRDSWRNRERDRAIEARKEKEKETPIAEPGVPKKDNFIDWE